MSYQFVYHYWNDKSLKRSLDMVNPVVLSIATLRYHHPDVDVSVIDISDEDGDWGHYPDKLNFKVIKQHPAITLPHSNNLHISYNTWKYCSSTFDVTGVESSHNKIVFVDSDIMFLRPLLPLPDFDGKFHCRDGFVGHYYYDRSDQNVNKMISLWKKYIIEGITNRELRSKITSLYRVPNFMNQESAYVYLCQSKDVLSYIKPMSIDQHCFESKHPSTNLRLFHFAGYYFWGERAYAVFCIDEFNRMLESVLGDDVESISGLAPSFRGRFKFDERNSLTGKRLCGRFVKSLSLKHL